MKGKKWFVLAISLGVVLLSSSVGITRSSFVDLETSSGNSFTAWTSTQWVQTTRTDFDAGVLNNTDTSLSPGDVKLGSVSGEPTTSVGSEESWYYASWGRRAPITINNPGSGLTDYQVKVDVTYDADMQPDFDDIRFRDSDELTELSHWRESYTASTSATFWIKVPSIPSGNKTIYMCYGNTGATSASDGNATFLFYDDFEAGSLDTKWTVVLGAQSTDWTFSGASDYTYDSAKIEVSGGYAHLVESSSPAWYDTNWSYRKQISIDHMKVVADLADFPVLISLPSDADLAADAQSDGDDILFTSSDGTKLCHEIESFNGTTGNLIAWVKVPSLSSATDTDIYMYYGNSSASNQQNATGVWDSNFKMVQHLQETSGTQYDSTSNNNDGSATAAVNKDAAGVIDGADYVSGVSNTEQITVLDNASLDLTTQTVSMWFKQERTDATISYDRLISKKTTWNDPNGWSIELNGANSGGAGMLTVVGSGSGYTRVACLAAWDTAWHHLAVTFAGTSAVVHFDGVNKGTSTINALVTNAVNLMIGWQTGEAGILGIIDEVRISDTVRSAAWIETSYNNQNDPSTFYSVGAEAVPSYPSDAPTIQSVSGRAYSELLSFTETLGPANQGQVKYQISNDGTSWYYHDGISWVAATGFAQTNTAAEVNASISSFDNDVGTGTFYFKAFLSSDGTQQVQLDQVSVETDGFWSRATDQKHSGTYALKAGVASGSNRYISATGINQADVAFDAWWYNTATNPDICQNVRASTATPLTDYHINWEGQWTIAEMPWNPLNSVAGSLPQNTWFKMTVIIQGTSMKVLKDDVQINPTSGWLNVGTKYASGSIGFRSWSASNNWWVDDVRARKYADPEPTTSIGSEESWYYPTWSRRAPVTVSNPGSGLTDFQVRVDITYDPDMQPDFDDIRFTDSDDSTELPHWRESYVASASATFWVKVPSIPSGAKTIYMYYGNASASSASNGTATFLFYDDFEDGTVGQPPAGWTMHTGCTGVVVQDDGGNKVLDDGIGSGGNVIAGDPSWTDIAVRQKVRSVDNVISHAGAVIRYTDEGNEVYGGIVTDTTAGIWNRVGGAWTQIGGTWIIPDVGTSWHVQELRIASDTVELYIDDEYIGSGTLTSAAPTSGASGFWCQYSHQGYRDEHIVRKYAPRIYVSSGTIASQVRDTGVAGASWDALFWDETLPSNTNVTFEVRASDTVFAKDAATPSWTSVGGTSPVTSGLPSGRYMQWRATLTTSDTSKPPTLHEVRVYHY